MAVGGTRGARYLTSAASRLVLSVTVGCAGRPRGDDAAAGPWMWAEVASESRQVAHSGRQAGSSLSVQTCILYGHGSSEHHPTVPVPLSVTQPAVAAEGAMSRLCPSYVIARRKHARCWQMAQSRWPGGGRGGPGVR